MTPYERIRALLDDAGVAYRHIHHEPTPTSADSARARGESIAIGAKALVMKVDETFRLFVLSAALRSDARAIRRFFGASKSRFATPEELLDLTGLVPGSVPPFGRPVLDLDLFVDPSVFANERMAFNAGSLTDSIIMAPEAYRALANPVVFSFAEAG
ncbi:MAG: YbaK/EbsC family protein [Rhodothermales bacterium]